MGAAEDALPSTVTAPKMHDSVSAGECCDAMTGLMMAEGLTVDDDTEEYDSGRHYPSYGPQERKTICTHINVGISLHIYLPPRCLSTRHLLVTSP